MWNFAKMVWSKELIEHGIKNKKIEGKSTHALYTKKNTPSKKKEGDTYVIFTNQQFMWQASCTSQFSYTANHLPPIQLLSYNSAPAALPTPIKVSNPRNNYRSGSVEKKLKLIEFRFLI